MLGLLGQLSSLSPQDRSSVKGYDQVSYGAG